jgi:FlgD Ig-like domain/Right handed beta helix region
VEPLEYFTEDETPMKPYSITLAVLVQTILIFSTALGSTFTIPGQHPDLGSALELMKSGDTLEIAPGIYYENNLTIPSGVSIVGMGSGPYDVILDAQGSGRIFILESLEQPATIKNITFRNGRASGESSYDQSGGAIFSSNSIAIFYNCNFITNKADSHGGAIRCNNSSPLIMNCTFAGNSAVNGGGGAIDSSYNSNPIVQGCIFNANTANWGGGLSCRGGSSPDVRKTTFDDNNASGDSAMGGAVFADFGSMPTFSLTTFCDNRADYGGALACLADSKTNLANCTIAGNESYLEGGGIFLFDATPNISTTLITFNTGSGISAWGESQPDISCTDLYGNSDGDWVGEIAHLVFSQDNMSVDPQFCSQKQGDWNRFYVSNGSPIVENQGRCTAIGSKPAGCSRTSDWDSTPAVPGVGQVSAWPNPFNPRTTIHFDIVQPQRVQVSVFNLQGALVRKLADRDFPSGAQSLQWNGDDQAGRQISSGAYFVVVQGQQDRQTIKMTMLK